MQCRCQICLFEAVFHTLVHTFQIVSFFFEFILSVTPVLLFSVLFPNFRSFLCNLSSPFLPPFYLLLSIFISLLHDSSSPLVFPSITLWSRSAKNPDCSTGPLACPLACLLAPLIHSLAAPSLLRSTALRRAHWFAHLFTSLTPSLMGQ